MSSGGNTEEVKNIVKVSGSSAPELNEAYVTRTRLRPFRNATYVNRFT